MVTLKGHYIEKIELGPIYWPRKNNLQILFFPNLEKKLLSAFMENTLNSDFFGPNGTRFARAISGPKKSRFSGPTPSNAPRNDVTLLKTITYRAIKTTGTLLVILAG